jgi:hypothetical protein
MKRLRMSIAAVAGIVVIAGGGISAAQPVPGLTGNYSSCFDSTA